MKINERYKHLLDTYPKILTKDGPRCGIQISIGWLPIVETVLKSLTEDLERLAPELQGSYYVEQIKEKFGGLRIYMSSETERMSECIRLAEIEASRTCEVCGCEGKLVNINYLMTVRCPKHDAKINYESEAT